MANRILTLLYGITCYAFGVASFILLAGFLISIPESIGIDRAREYSTLVAISVNVALLLLFGLQHSVMARPAFKRWWTKFVPKQVERSTYVLFSAIALSALVLLWQPMGGRIWEAHSNLTRSALYLMYTFGWIILFASTFFINHFDLFGLRQVYLYFTGRDYSPVKFKISGPYKRVRHPLYVGWLTLFWMTPTMTVAHFVLALGITAYIIVAIKYEERDLIDHHGIDYLNYRETTPMLIPSLRSPIDTQGLAKPLEVRHTA